MVLFVGGFIAGCAPHKENYIYRPAFVERIPPAIPKRIYPMKEDMDDVLCRLTLQDAIKIALKYNPDIEVTLTRIRQAEAAIGEVDAEFLPVLTTTTAYVYADAPSVYLFKKIDEREFNPNTNFNYPGTISNFETDFTLQGNVYKGGISLLNRWKAEKGESLKYIDHLSLKNVLTATVIEAYYNSLALDEAIKVAEASANKIHKQLEIAQARFEEGALMKSDLLFLEVRFAEAQEEVVKARNSFRMAIASLANLLGKDADVEIEVVPENEDWIALPENYESALALALRVRPELLAARKRVEIASVDVDMVKREFLPKIDAFGKVYWDDPHLQYSGKRTNWETGGEISWSIFEGGKRYYSLSKAREILKEMLEEDRKTTLSVQLSIKRAYLNYESSQARLEAVEMAVRYAEENLRIVTEQYLEGERSVTEYLDAELAEMKNFLREIQAFYEIKKSQAAIAMSAGLFSLEGDDQ